MTEILEIWFGIDKKLQEGINFTGRNFVEQLAMEKLTLSSNFIIIATKFAESFSDIYDAFFFEINHRDETHGYI